MKKKRGAGCFGALRKFYGNYYFFIFLFVNVKTKTPPIPFPISCFPHIQNPYHLRPAHPLPYPLPPTGHPAIKVPIFSDLCDCVIPLAACITPIQPHSDIPTLPYSPLRCKTYLAMLNPFSQVNFTARSGSATFATSEITSPSLRTNLHSELTHNTQPYSMLFPDRLTQMLTRPRLNPILCHFFSSFLIPA